ncbi:MAG: serine hydrolase [Pseudomonadota bacterium]
MKSLSMLIAFVGVVFTTNITASAQAQPPRSEFGAIVEQYVERRGFSGSVLIARQGEVIFEQAYGEASKEWGVKNTLNARYRIGSLSKPFLATLIMKLSESGALALEDTLGQHLPELYADTPASPITIAQLLSHTSGIKDLPGRYDDPWYQTTARLAYEPTQLANEWIKPELTEEPGSVWRYNNAGYILLGLIVEAATGQSYAENLQKHLFQPAKMASSGVFDENAVLPRLAQGYAKAPDGELIRPLKIDASVFFSAAGIYSSAHDILRFDSALYDPAYIGGTAKELMFTRKTDFPYGFGWGVEEWPLGDNRTLSVTHHTGSIPGYQSFYIRSEKNRDAVIVLNNTNNGSATIEMGRNLMIMLNNGVAPEVKRRLADYLGPIEHAGGVEAVQQAIEDFGPELAEYDTRERTLNRLGYSYLGQERPEIAVVLFKWATQLFPNSANLYDSLGEGHRAAGDTQAAIESYERALGLDPDLQSAKNALTELRAD